MPQSPFRPLLSTLACLTTACTAPGGPPPSIDPAFLLPQMGRAVLIVSRGDSVVDDACSYRLEIDAYEAGSLPPKGWITLYPPTGAHIVSVRAEGVGCPSTVQVRTQVEANRQQRFQVVRAANGGMSLSDESLPFP